MGSRTFQVGWSVGWDIFFSFYWQKSPPPPKKKSKKSQKNLTFLEVKNLDKYFQLNFQKNFESNFLRLADITRF